MPNYEYACESCGAVITARRASMVRLGEDEPETCGCGGLAPRAFTRTGVLQVPNPVTTRIESTGPSSAERVSVTYEYSCAWCGRIQTRRRIIAKRVDPVTCECGRLCVLMFTPNGRISIPKAFGNSYSDFHDESEAQMARSHPENMSLAEWRSRSSESRKTDSSGRALDDIVTEQIARVEALPEEEVTRQTKEREAARAAN